MEITEAKILVFYTRDWLYESGGYDEDGAPCLDIDWQVIAETTTGKRWIKNFSFNEENKAIKYIKEIEDLIKYYPISEVLAPDAWSSMEPSYGSEEYARLYS